MSKSKGYRARYKARGSGRDRASAQSSGLFDNSPTVEEFKAGTRMGLENVFGRSDAAQIASALGIPGGSNVVISGDGGSVHFLASGGTLREGRGMEMTVSKSPYGTTLRLSNVHVTTQGQGHGTEIFNRLRSGARAEGIDRVTMDASGSTYKTKSGETKRNNGYYTWAKLGVDGPIPSKVKKALKDSPYKGATRVQQVISKPGGSQWWKEHGDSFEGEIIP